jgi:hypothetical protein
MSGLEITGPACMRPGASARRSIGRSSTSSSTIWPRTLSSPGSAPRPTSAPLPSRCGVADPLAVASAAPDDVSPVASDPRVIGARELIGAQHQSGRDVRGGPAGVAGPPPTAPARSAGGHRASCAVTGERLARGDRVELTVVGDDYWRFALTVGDQGTFGVQRLPRDRSCPLGQWRSGRGRHRVGRRDPQDRACRSLSQPSVTQFRLLLHSIPVKAAMHN